MDEERREEGSLSRECLLMMYVRGSPSRAEMSQEQWMHDILMRRRAEGTFRELRTPEKDVCFVDFTSNDYLGLGRAADLRQAAEAEARRAREVGYYVNDGCTSGHRLASPCVRAMTTYVRACCACRVWPHYLSVHTACRAAYTSLRLLGSRVISDGCSLDVRVSPVACTFLRAEQKNAVGGWRLET